jgi:RNA polymerase sigma factor (sigma-70 family)
MGSRPKSPRNSSDANVIARSLGRPEQFALIFHRHFGVVHSYLARRVGPSSADHLAAQTFVVAFERRHSFSAGAADARPWLFGIATNLMRNEWRAEQRSLAALARLPRSEHSAPQTELPGSELLGAALEQLDHGQRDALLLYAWEGLSYDEIAVALDVPIGTVRSRIARARARLSAALSDTDPSREEMANDR